MNANELADLIGMCGDGGYNQDAAAMLRQQQERIIKLETALQGWEIGFEKMGYERLVKDKDEAISQQQTEIEALKALNKSIMDDPLQFMRIKAEYK